MKTAIRKHRGDFLAIIALFVMAAGVSAYILTNQRLRFPLVQDKAFPLEVELPNAQAVTPGQGQTVRVSGVEIGQIGKIELEEGVAVVKLAIEPKYKTLIREDASALLRARTGVKDMFIEVDPGEGKPMKENGRIRVANTQQDVDPDEILAALDSDTRDYLRLLISGAGKGLKGRGSDLQETFARLGPVHKDLAKVTKAIGRRRANMRRLIHNYGLLTTELGKNDRDIRRLVASSDSVFEALAAEETNISNAVARLPGALRETGATLAKVNEYSPQLQSALESLRPAFRQLDETNAEIIPLAKEGAPILKNEVRPFARAAQPFTRKFGKAGEDLAKGAPEITTTLGKLNRLFNLGAYNPRGAEGLTGNIGVDRDRNEGYLYWLAWTAQNTVSMFSTSDATGPFRRFYLGGLSCTTLEGLIADQAPPELEEIVGDIGSALGTAGVCATSDAAPPVELPTP